MAMKLKIGFYSMDGHIYEMAEAVAEGAKEEDCEGIWTPYRW